MGMGIVTWEWEGIKNCREIPTHSSSVLYIPATSTPSERLFSTAVTVQKRCTSLSTLCKFSAVRAQQYEVVL